MPTENLTIPVCYYDVLQVSPRSGDDEIKRAYRRLAMVYHPDLNPQNRSIAELRFRLINEAYAHLKTRDKRAHYNHYLRPRTMPRENNTQPANNDNVARSWFSQLAAMFRTPSGSKA